MIKTLFTLAAATICALLVACDSGGTSGAAKPERQPAPQEKAPGMDFQDASKADQGGGAASGRGNTGGTGGTGG